MGDSEDADFCWPYDDLDYDLAPWVEAGKLCWLGDEADDYPLQRGMVEEFPYTTLDGLRGRWAIFGKRLRLLPNDVPPHSLNLAVYQKRAFERTRHLEAQSLQDRALRSVRIRSLNVTGLGIVLACSLCYTD